MNKDSEVTFIQLTNKQIGFNKRLFPIIHLFGITSFLIFTALYFSKEFQQFFGLLPILLSGITFAFYAFLPNVEPCKFFHSKIDNDGKTREDKLKEFWEKVLSSQNEIKIEKVNVQTEDYMQTQVLKENTGVSKSVRMIWRDIVLFERNNEGNVSHLEGMPSILMLRE